MWRDNTPKLAVKHPYNSRLLIALSALHLAREDPSRSGPLLAKCNALQATAINGMITALSSNEPGSAGALWVAAMLLCFCSFGKGPQPGQYLVYSDDGEPEWLGLLQGVKSIITHNENPYDGIVREQHSEGPPIERVAPEEVLPGISKAFEDLRSSIQAFQAEDGSFNKYVKPLDELQSCFSEVFERVVQPDTMDIPPPRIRQDQVLAWLYRIEGDYVTSIQERRPMSLVILAHYLVLLEQMRDVWYIDGWPGHVMGAMRRDIHTAYTGWLAWPMKYVK